MPFSSLPRVFKSPVQTILWKTNTTRGCNPWGWILPHLHFDRRTEGPKTKIDFWMIVGLFWEIKKKKLQQKLQTGNYHYSFPLLSITFSYLGTEFVPCSFQQKCLKWVQTLIFNGEGPDPVSRELCRFHLSLPFPVAYRTDRLFSYTHLSLPMCIWTPRRVCCRPSNCFHQRKDQGGERRGLPHLGCPELSFFDEFLYSS